MIAGCGDLGTRVGLRLANPGTLVFGLRYSSTPLPLPLRTLQGDLGDLGTLKHLPSDVDTLVYAAAARERSEAGYRRLYLQGLQNILEALQRSGSRPSRILFVSSTAVYGQSSAEWLDESSTTQPEAFNGRVLLEAEQWLHKHHPKAIVARLSGIYGPGRRALIERVRSGRAVCQEQPPVYSNRIHVDDAAGAITHLLSLESTQSPYIISDSRPTPQCEVMDWLAQRLGVSAARRETRPTRALGKRLSNQRLLESGYSLRYPDFVAGYGALIGEQD